MNKDQIRATVKKVNGLTKVPVPEWDGEVYLRVCQGKYRDEWEHKCKVTAADIKTFLLAATLCDEAGKLVYNPDDPEDYAALNECDANVLLRLFYLAVDLNAVSADEVKELKKSLKEATNASSDSN